MSEIIPSSSDFSRRDLAKQLLAGATMVGVTVPISAADEPATNAPENDCPEVSPVDAQLAWLRDRYPSEHLTSEQIAEIRRDLQRRQMQSELIRQYPLDHTDTSGHVFAAFRSEDE